jgi:hypothetical protein
MITAAESAAIVDAGIEARYREMVDKTIPEWAKIGSRVITFKGLTEAHRTELIEAGYKVKESSLTAGEWFIEW